MFKRKLGRTSVELTVAGFGGVTLGEIYERIPESQARATLEAAWQSGIRYFDTSPWYGRGLSELRFGASLRQQNRDEFVLSSKVGRVFHRPNDPKSFKHEFWKGGVPFEFRFDYTYDGLMRSYEQSQMRLGIPNIDLLLIHDLDKAEMGGSEDLVKHHLHDLETSGWRALEELKRHNEIAGIGAGVNILGTIPMFLERFDLDFFLVAMPYTLLDQDVLNEEFPMCQERGVGVVVGSPYASGILATGTQASQPMYNYEPAEAHIIDRVGKIEKRCAEFNVPLKAASYQFPLLSPIVASVISGGGSPAQALENAGLVDVEIPADFWRSLLADGLIHPSSPIPA